MLAFEIQKNICAELAIYFESAKLGCLSVVQRLIFIIVLNESGDFNFEWIVSMLHGKIRVNEKRYVIASNLNNLINVPSM